MARRPGKTDAVDPGTPAGVVHRWAREIALYEKDASRWHEKGRKIVKRYKDERSTSQENSVRFNVLWSNIQTFLPACYGRNPKPEVERRFRDKDPVGRVASEVLERCLEHVIAACDFKTTVRAALLDRLLPGRGVLWARYVPHMRDMSVSGAGDVEEGGVQVTDDAVAEPSSNVQAVDTDPAQEVYFEEVAFDYVHWEDFGHTAARTWGEMRSPWRKVYLTRQELVERFGEEIGNAVPLMHSPAEIPKDQVTDDIKKAVVYEIWDKPSKKAIWICKDYAKEPLDTRDDPLKLSGFFPCPRPMFATLANDNLLPVPDYRQYQDQASELDELTARIASITKAIKVAGVYDKASQGVERLLSEGVENTLIPVESWAMYAEKGGLKGSMELLPVKDIAETLLSLYEARDKVKQDLYEITGMPDIIRGSDDADATATAQRIKGQFGSIRLRDMQDDVQRFVRDLLNIGGEIMAKHFGWQTLSQISGIKLLSQQEKALIQAQMAAMQHQQPQPGMPPVSQPQMPPIDPAKLKLMSEPSWEEVEALLRDNCERAFRIDIETDSTIGEDDELEREARLKMVETLGEFISKAVESCESTPQLAPVAAEMVMYVVRSFKNARALEAQLEQAMEKLVETAANPPAPKPNPDVIKAQGQLQIIQAQAQADNQQAAQDQQFKQALETQKLTNAKELESFKAAQAAHLAQTTQAAQQQQATAQNQIEAQRESMQAEHQAQLERMKAMFDAQAKQQDAALAVFLARINNAAKVEVAEIAADTQLEAAQISAANSASEGD